MSTSVMAALAAKRSAHFSISSLPGGGILVANLMLVIVAVFFLHIDLFGRGSLSTLTPVIGVMMIVALGQAFIVGTGGIDLSIPATVTLVGIIILKSSAGDNGSLAKALLLAAAACVLIGLMNGLLVEVLHLNALVVTLATGQLIAGITRMYRGPVLAVSQVPSKLSDFASASIFNLSAIMLVAIAVGVAVALWLKFHVTGRTVAASSVARAAAANTGLAATRQRIVAWIVGTLMVGLGGVLLAGQISTPDLTLGSPYLLTSIVAVVLGGAAISGGRVKVAGTLLGALFIMLLEHIFRVRGYSSGVSSVVEGLVLGGGLALVIGARTVRWTSLFAAREESTEGRSMTEPTNEQNSQE